MKRPAIVLGVVLTLLSVDCAFGSIAAVEWSGSGTSTTGTPLSLGYLFTVDTSTFATDLGVYDHEGNGLVQSHGVGLWTGGGTLLASTTVLSGTASTLDGHFRYESIAPVALTAGSRYVVAAADLSNGDPYVYELTGFSSAPGITFVDDRWSIGTGLLLPTSSDTISNGWFGGNLKIDAIPEPSTLGIWGVLGGLGLIAARRRRKQVA